MRVKQYKLIESEYAHSMNQLVNEYIEDGWHVYGHPSIARSRYTTYIIQAMVKYAPPTNSNDGSGSDEPAENFEEGMFTL